MIGFNNYKIEAIKIDTQPIYKLDAESEWFIAFRENKAQPIINENEYWNNQIAERVAVGARHIRIKLIDETNALAFRIQNCAIQTIYPEQIKSGGEYHFMKRTDFYDLVKNTFSDEWQPNDFWLFDKTDGIEQFYNDDFSYKDDAQISSDDLSKYIKLCNVVLQSDKLFDINEYKQRYLK